MATRLTQRPEKTFRDLFEANWTPGNTSGYDPTATAGTTTWLPIHFGEYEGDMRDPQIVLSNFAENVLGGGTALASGVAGDGSGVTQDRVGSGLATVFAEVGGSYRSSDNAETTVFLIRSELEAIVQAAGETGYGDFRYVGSRYDGGSTPPNATPPVYQEQVFLRYGWEKRP